MKRHPFDAISLVFGLLFAGIGAVFWFGSPTLGDLDPALAWIVPTMLVGTIALLVGIGRLRRPSRADVDIDADDAHTG